MLKALGIAVVLILAAAVAGVFVFGETYRVPGRGMTPDLQPGDRILVLEFRGPMKPEPGQLVAYHAPSGQCGAARGAVFIHRLVRRTGHARFVLRGDNPRRSCDSRAFGPVPRKLLIGEVVAVYWPPSRWGLR